LYWYQAAEKNGDEKLIKGNSYGTVYITEANECTQKFVQECFDRTGASSLRKVFHDLNPKDERHWYYTEVLAHHEALQSADATYGYNYGHFTIADNLSVDDDQLRSVLRTYDKTTVWYQRDILGLRKQASGLIFTLRPYNVISEDEAFAFRYRRFVCSVDTAYSSKTNDTFALMYQGITDTGKCIALEEHVFNNKGRTVAVSPSDVPRILESFLSRCAEKWGPTRKVYVDSADSATLSELAKHKRRDGSAYTFEPAFKRMTVINRLRLQQGWLTSGDYLIVNSCKEYLHEFSCYRWKEDKDEPEDGNDHCINATQYGWLPYKKEIGGDTHGAYENDI
jgi:PBSX family phage terminase large subunit